MIMSCPKISPETLTALHESALPWWQVLALKAHTKRCAACQTQFASLTHLDNRLRTLAPIPIELSLAPIRRRKILLGSSVALAVLGLGAWRFFTPEIEWEQVERELHSAKKITWTRTEHKLQSTFLDSPIEWVAIATDLSIPKSTPETLLLQYERAHPERVLFRHKNDFSLRTGNGFASGLEIQSSKYEYLFTYNPQNRKPHLGVILSNGRRLLAFSSELHNEINTGSDKWEVFSGRFTVLVDPKTKRIVERSSITRRSGKTSFSSYDTDFHYEK
jgi:hypothetical protein